MQVASVSVLLGSSPTSPLYLPISPLYLVQVASVSVLLGSSVVSLTRNEPWITPVHALAYILMFIGGARRVLRCPLSLRLYRASAILPVVHSMVA